VLAATTNKEIEKSMDRKKNSQELSISEVRKKKKKLRILSRVSVKTLIISELFCVPLYPFHFFYSHVSNK
jgi:virulence family protein